MSPEIVFLISIVAFSGAWWFIARAYRKNGCSALKTHTAGLTTGVLAFIICVLILASVDRSIPFSAAALTIAVLIGLCVFALWTVKSIKRLVKRMPKVQRNPSSPNETRKKVEDEIAKIKGLGSRPSVAPERTWIDNEDYSENSENIFQENIDNGRAFNSAYTPEYHISYVDANGEYTDRDITVHSATKTRIQAYCHEREDERTFLVDRVEEGIIDHSTGEVLSKRQWIRQIS